ncbi:ABC transporter ATP-binding protein [Deferribacterales bacterium RsTz2092]|nr:ABC transporter ATP-binding protein [Deferribacterales bacterium]
MEFEVKNLHVSYGGIVALDGLYMNVSDGEIVCLIGSNGAGKSSLLRAISGLVKPAIGQIIFNGQDISNLPPHKIVSMGVSHSPEGRRVFASLTVEENLLMGSYILSHVENTILDFVYTTFPVLKERAKQFAGTLSGGEQQMLSIGRSLMSKPELLLLDEPSLGLSPLITKELFALIKLINESQGISILLVEQNAKAALKLSSRGYVLDVGYVTMEGKSADLLNSQQLKESYLGKEK